MKLSEKIQAVAQGAAFYGEALYAAMTLDNVVTSNDRLALMRYAYGNETTKDRFILQDLAIELEYAGY